MLIKSAAVLAVVSTLGSAAIAGPYANVESNAGWVGDDYTGAVTDVHVGYEGDLSTSAGWYIQGGPAFVSIDGEELETRYSGKVGLGVDVTERLNLYSELSALTASETFEMDDLNLGGKLGAKYSF